MSKEFRSLSYGFTVLDCEDLPPGWYADDVVNELDDVIQEAISVWYNTRGYQLLTGEPV